jgi:D-psicose/D-tagatose/L-ribulose 3-epimerase
MHVALCNEVLRDMPFEQQCAFARSVGYDGLEIAPFTLGHDPHLLTNEKRVQLRRAANDAGIAITSLHYLLLTPAGLSITAADQLLRARTVDVMRRLCGLAADLGASILVHGSPAQRWLEPGDETEGRKRAVECFAAVADTASDASVTYLIEPLARPETTFINTVEEAAAVVSAISSPAIKTMIDCSAAARSEDASIPTLLSTWLPTGLVTHIHLNDPNRRGPGEGELLFTPILQTLKEQAYRGVAAIEPFVYDPDGPACAARAIGYIRGIEEAVR